MSMLDDPALGLQATDHVAAGSRIVRVRFRQTSAFARDMKLPSGATGVIAWRYLQDGRERLNVQIDGGPYCFGVPMDEVMPYDRGHMAHT